MINRLVPPLAGYPQDEVSLVSGSDAPNAIATQGMNRLHFSVGIAGHLTSGCRAWISSLTTRGFKNFFNPLSTKFRDSNGPIRGIKETLRTSGLMSSCRVR